MSERKIQVRIGDKVSSKRPVDIGVPQGSVLGPYIFIFYINFVLKLMKLKCPDLKIITYADDTTLLYPVDKYQPEICIHKFNSSIDTCLSLFSSFQLVVNVSKTKCLHSLQSSFWTGFILWDRGMGFHIWQCFKQISDFSKWRYESNTWNSQGSLSPTCVLVGKYFNS